MSQSYFLSKRPRGLAFDFLYLFEFVVLIVADNKKTMNSPVGEKGAKNIGRKAYAFTIRSPCHDIFCRTLIYAIKLVVGNGEAKVTLAVLLGH